MKRIAGIIFIRALGYLVTLIVVTITSPLWIILLVTVFVESPRTLLEILTNKENWRPLSKRGEHDKKV